MANEPERQQSDGSREEGIKRMLTERRSENGEQEEREYQEKQRETAKTIKVSYLKRKQAKGEDVERKIIKGRHGYRK